MHGDENNAEVIFAVDAGGTFLKSAEVSGGRILREFPQIPSRSDGTAEEIAGAFRRVFRFCGNAGKIAVSMPGPFDFKRGISLMTEKFAAVRGRNPVLLAGETREVRFRQDAVSFLDGERLYGAGRGFSRLGGITLGTGLGAAVFTEKGFLLNELGSPAPETALWKRPFDGLAAEDWFSARGLLRLSGGIDGKTLEAMARSGHPEARDVWHRFGCGLARLLEEWAKEFRLDRIVIGGQIAKAFDLFGEPLAERNAVPSERGTAAALLGAAEAYHTGQGMKHVNP